MMLTCARDRNSIQNDILSLYLQWTVIAEFCENSLLNVTIKMCTVVQTMWKFLCFHMPNWIILQQSPPKNFRFILNYINIVFYFTIPNDKHWIFTVFNFPSALSRNHKSCQWFNLTFSGMCLQISSRFLLVILTKFSFIHVSQCGQPQAKSLLNVTVHRLGRVGGSLI